jgi:Big-like domain-containing protein
MKKIPALFVMLLAFMLAACNGPSGKNGDPIGELVATTVKISTYNSAGVEQQSFAKNEVITLTATVLDQLSQPMAGQKVDFTVDLGELNMNSKLTNSQGQATVTITNSTLLLSAGTINASVVVNDSGTPLSASVKNYEFIETSAVIVLPSLSSELLLDGVSVNQFKADQSVTVFVNLVDGNNQAIANEIIDFTVEKGVLSATSALTDANGQASVILTGNENIGAGILTAVYRKDNVATLLNYQILAADVIIVDLGIQIGAFDQAGQFNQGDIALSVTDNTISAGGTLGLTVDLVDSEGNRVQTPTPVSFTSTCVANSAATIDASVFTVNGRARATFEDTSCAGASGSDDVIIASVTINGVTQTASANINIKGEQLGSIEFISAQPSSIVLKGTGGQGNQETSMLTFKVKSELGNLLAQQQVAFSLDTDVGGISLNPLSGLSNSQGLITTQVTAGSVPTAVRVTAKSSLTQDGQTVEVQTQSDLLSVNTGLPEQRSITLSATILNPEANTHSGEESEIRAYLADNFNNPVPDGTTVNFTTEGGVIDPSCTTINGNCSVIWRSAEPRVVDHRITILATALGHETFFDTNGNNTFDDSDGSAIVSSNASSGLERFAVQNSGFFDMSEAWRDDNESKTYEQGELFIDFNSDNSFTQPDGVFNGPQCQGSLCASTASRSVNVRKAIILIMASSDALWHLTNTSNLNIDLVASDGSGIGIGSASTKVSFLFSDTSAQTMPVGTTVTQSDVVIFTVSNNNNAGDARIDFEVSSGTVLDLKIITPKGFITPVKFTFP